MKKLIYKVNVYIGGLSSFHSKCIFESHNKKTAYAVLENYLRDNPNCVKAFIDEEYEN